MSSISKEEAEARKKAVFDAMKPRMQKWILKRGYEQWDPFQKPKDPVDIRKEATGRTTHMLVGEFLKTKGTEDHSPAFDRGVLDLALGIVNNDDYYLGMLEFSRWYDKLLKSEGYKR